MALTSEEIRRLRQIIESTLIDHIGSPFRILRERGIVAELRGRIVADESLGCQIDAELRRRPRRHLICGPTCEHRVVKVCRTQLEITAIDHRRDGISKTVDIAILTSKPTLFHEKHGQGDVIQQVCPTAIAAAIEVKASPSSDATAGGEYAKDIASLLWLASEFGVSSSFILFDKSLALFGLAGESEQIPTEPSRWLSTEPDAFRLRYRANESPGKPASSESKNLNDLGIDISFSLPCGSEPFVEVWTIEYSTSGKWVPQCRYATLMTGATNIHMARP